MPWQFTADPHSYAERVWPLLAARPVESTVALTVLADLAAGRRWSEGGMLFGWYTSDAGPDAGPSAVRGAVCRVPPYALLLAAVPADTVAALADALRGGGHAVPGVTGEAGTVADFRAAWEPAAGRGETGMRMRLYALDHLAAPPPRPPGRARPASPAEADLAASWLDAFAAESGLPAVDPRPIVQDRTADARLWFWVDGSGTPVSLAARNRPAAGASRIGPVYTPPAGRGRGYGTALTAALCADALARGVRHLVLFADLANATSNAIYARIGFRPVAEHETVHFGA